MSYESRLDQMIASHVGDYQAQLMLAKMMENCVETISTPNGYTTAVYHPKCACQTPEAKEFIARTGGKLSNGVPKVLGMELVHGYVLGAYNPISPTPPPDCST